VIHGGNFRVLSDVFVFSVDLWKNESSALQPFVPRRRKEVASFSGEPRVFSAECSLFVSSLNPVK
jgi:hypothetical protein